MPRYGVATYGMRNKSKTASSEQEFDVARSERTETVHSPEKTRKIEQKKNRERDEVPQANKRRKVVPLHEDELFGFNENDSDTGSTQTKPTAQRRNIFKKLKSKSTAEGSTDGTDKSTDDEAYCSSHEPTNSSQESLQNGNEKPTQRQSPFKHFLKNNVASLSPKKKRKYDSRRFSALPTNIGTSEEELSDGNPETKSLNQNSSCPETQSTSSSRVRVNREEKKLFTVVRNVKHKHACLEDGETQQFFDDVDFALDGLRKDLSLAARCSSALELAAQCSAPLFRVNLRAHGIICKIFDALQDAPSNKTLALCTSFVFYMVTRDRVIVDFDNAILDLLLKLLCVSEDIEIQKKEKKSVHEEMLKRTRQILTRLPESFTSYLDMENLSSASLARESLLSLTSERTIEWFKKEMRTLGGLDYIVNIVLTSIENIQDNVKELFENEKGIENVGRFLKLIENVTFQNQENQQYLVSCKKSSLIVALARLMKVCIHGIIEDELASQCIFFKTVLNCVKSVLRVFMNLTHDNDGESETIGQQDGLISALLLCVLQVPQFITVEEQFDILVLALGLLINLAEHSKQNIASLIVLDTPLSYENQQNSEGCKSNRVVPSVEALVHLFLIRQEAAKKNENMTGDMANGDSDELKPTKDGLGWVCGDDIDVSRDEDDEHEGSVSKSEENDAKNSEEISPEDEIRDALQKAGKHMEDSMVASYVALLLGCIAQDNKSNQNLIRQLLPEKSFTVLIDTLKTFLGFMKLTSGTTGQAIERIIDVLKAC